MSQLNLKKLQPGDTVNFVVEGKIFENIARSAAIEVKIPTAAPLMSKVTTTYSPPVTIYTNTYNGGDEFGFIRFQKAGTLGASHYRLRLYFDTKKPKNQLSNGDIVRMIVNHSALTALNGQQATVYSSGISNDKSGSYIDLKVSNSYQTTQNSGNASKANNYLKESTGKKKQKKYTIQIPDAPVFQKLINVKEKVSGASSWAIRDIPIYAYRNYDGQIKSGDKLLSMLNDSEINFKEPPTYSLNLEENFLVKSYTRIFDLGDKPNYMFYVAIARYTKKDGNWKGEWLQTSSSNKPVWSKAVKNGN
jgi:hypothetical protein